MTFVFIGLPGSGKSTQAERLAQYFNIRYMETGEMFRRAAKENSERGERIARSLALGELVNESDMEYVLSGLLEAMKGGDPVIVDGFPRDLSQAQKYRKYIDHCYFLDVPDKICVDRLVRRNRADDEPCVINLRIQHFWDRTKPMLEWLNEEGIVTVIDGNRSQEEVFDDLVSHIWGRIASGEGKIKKVISN